MRPERSKGNPGPSHHGRAHFGRKDVERYAPDTDSFLKRQRDTRSLEGPTPTSSDGGNDPTGDLLEALMVQTSDIDMFRSQVLHSRSASLPADGLSIAPQVFLVKPDEVHGFDAIRSRCQRQSATTSRMKAASHGTASRWFSRISRLWKN